VNAAQLRASLRAHWALLGVLAAYIASAFLVPTLAPVSISDDPIYARSVEILVHNGNFRVLPISVVSLVAQVWWGALFQWIFHDSLGVLRVATLSVTFLGGLATYGLCRALRVSTGRSALGAALYLFHPLSYVLGFTFMTDAYLTSLIAIASFCFVRALRDDDLDTRWLIAGSFASSIAFLIRQQGALVPIAVITYLLVARRLRRDMPSLRAIAAVLLAPVLTAIGYLVWFNEFHGTAGSAQVGVAKDLHNAGFGGTALLARRLLFIILVYAAFLVLPLIVAALGRLPRFVRSLGRAGWVLIAVWAFVLVAGLAFSPLLQHARMPYLAQFVSVSGLGPPGDLRGGRAPFVGPTFQYWLTVFFIAASVVLAVVFAQRIMALFSRRESRAALVATVLVVQIAAVIITSLPLRGTAISRDRYLLPLLPFVIALTLWALNRVRIAMWAAWAVIGAMAAFAVAGTHDYLSYQQTAWAVARRAHAEGVPYTRLDGGAAWDAYHLYEQSVQEHAHVDLKKLVGLTPGKPFLLSKHDVKPWWIGFYTPIANNDYVVTSEPLFTYDTLLKVKYSSWLHRKPQYIYLVRHAGLKDPPL
jgi:4-amino-4-deoxy-L-arabinose transferase-like glycosyltransferase